MHISVATANFYFLPFEESLEIIAEAGFQNIELDLFWERKQWSMAQHLRDIPVPQVIQSIHRSGLKVTSIHDGGGVLHTPHSSAGFINPRLDDYLDQLGYAPEYLVFHTPHVEGVQDAGWWERISGEIVRALDPYRTVVNDLTLENMVTFDGYTVPLITPEELRTFAVHNGFGVTVDTTHYAYMAMDLLEAARVLQSCIRSVHLSDYSSGRIHVFVGEGELDLAGFLSQVDSKVLNSVTLECSLSTVDKSDRQMSHVELVNRMKLLKAMVENLRIGEL